MFGVDVEKNGATASHVFRGLVKVEVIGVAVNRREAVLRENESALIEVDGVKGARLITEGLKVDPMKFVLRIPSPESARGSRAYEDLVLSLRPAVYYRMERPSNEKFRNLVEDFGGGNHHGRMFFSGASDEAYVPGHWGDALNFRGPDSGDGVIVDDYPKATDDHLTVSAWVLARSWMGVWPQISGNWGLKPGQFHFGLYKSDYDLAVKIMQRNGELLEVREQKQRFPLGIWQHVAFVVDKTELRLYRNGEKVASAKCHGLQPDPPMKSLAIGCKTDDSGEAVWGKHWYGLIDELAVFNKALSDEEIFRLFEGQPSPTKKRKEVEYMGD